MACNDITVTEENTVIDVVSDQKVVELKSTETTDLEVISESSIVDLKEDLSNVIEVTNVNSLTVSDLDLSFNCSVTENVRDVVYLTSTDTVAKANNSNIATARVIGFITSKPTTTTCKVRVLGLLDGFTGLEISKPYFLDSTSGAITKTPVTGVGSVLVRLGEPKSSTVFIINIDNNYIIRG